MRVCQSGVCFKQPESCNARSICATELIYQWTLLKKKDFNVPWTDVVLASDVRAGKWPILVVELVTRQEVQLRIIGMIMVTDHHHISMIRETSSGIRNMDKAIKSRYCGSYLDGSLPMISVRPCAQALQPLQVFDSFWSEQRQSITSASPKRN